MGGREAWWLIENRGAPSHARANRCRRCSRIGRRCPEFARLRPGARRAICTSRAPRLFSAKALRAPASCSSASSRVMLKMSRGTRSLVPPGRLLDRALEDAGIDRTIVYVTNVVKHFKWEPRGKRRIHAKPNAAEIGAMPPVARDRNRAGQAARARLPWRNRRAGAAWKSVPVSQQRGQFVRRRSRPLVIATVHPSSILRASDDETRREEMTRFVADLKKVAAAASGAGE